MEKITLWYKKSTKKWNIRTYNAFYSTFKVRFLFSLEVLTIDYDWGKIKSLFIAFSIPYFFYLSVYCKWNTHSYMLQEPSPTKLAIENLQGIFLPFRRKWAKDCQQSNKSAINQSINILVVHVFCAKLYLAKILQLCWKRGIPSKWTTLHFLIIHVTVTCFQLELTLGYLKLYKDY